MKTRRDSEKFYAIITGIQDAGERRAAMRELACSDLYFLLVWVLGRRDARNDWCFARCREVQRSPDGHLDLWARDHYKSTIISVALSIQDILRDPEVTIGVFSFNAAAAQDIVAQIKREFEARATLRWLFDDILWDRPSRDAPNWSVQNGITVNRKTNPRECTVEGHSFMEGAPVGKHFAICLYDDVVTMDSVATPEMISKTTNRWELSIPLGRKDARRRYVGTRYHFQDTYAEMISREAAQPRIYPAEGEDGEPVFLTRAQLDDKRKAMGPTTYAAQMMLDPALDSTAGFLEEWLRYYDDEPPLATMNVYILVDPANAKKKNSDWTAIWVIGLSSDYNYYVLDIVRDRLSLQERAKKLIELHRKWSPNAKQKVRKVGYEKYGKDADIEAITILQVEQNYRFAITALGGRLSKIDRINRLEPVCAEHRLYLPHRLLYTQYDGLTVDLVSHFRESEYKPYPAIKHDDMLDALARILDEDMATVWPKPVDNTTPLGGARKGSSWAA
jgi:predicted phage terminase large subunit-like protein